MHGDPETPAREANEWREAMARWHDVWRGYPMALVLLACTMLTASGVWALADGPPDTIAWLTGIAAVISSLAAVLEARAAAEVRHTVADHEARIRVLEDARNRQ